MKRDAGSLFAGARVTEAVSLAPLTTLRVGPVAVGMQLGQHGDNLFAADAGDQAPRDRAHPQSGQRRQRRHLGDARTREERTGHGP